MIVPAQLKALIVDDNGYARAAVAATLRQLGVGTIDEVAGAAAAVGALLATAYDVAFVDWYMPDMSGAALLEIVNDPRLPLPCRPLVVVITAYPNRETLARARELGAGEVLTKPFTATHVAAVLGKLLPDSWTVPGDGVDIIAV